VAEVPLGDGDRAGGQPSRRISRRVDSSPKTSPTGTAATSTSSPTPSCEEGEARGGPGRLAAAGTCTYTTPLRPAGGRGFGCLPEISALLSSSGTTAHSTSPFTVESGLTPLPPLIAAASGCLLIASGSAPTPGPPTRPPTL
jgi:hypothetical protein